MWQTFRQFIVLAVVLTLGIAIGTTVSSTQAGIGAVIPQVAIGTELLTETERVFAEVYKNVAPSVVSINVTFRTSNARTGSSSGSGFVVDTQGHIVTNYHVVEGANQIEVNFFDGTITRATTVGLDPDSDLAVIKVNLPSDRLRPVVMGNSNTVQVGQTTLAIGNPYSKEWTLTSGIISALNRRIIGLNSYSIGGVIQTDAAINPGNSGGPLLNLRGEVIGVNSQITTESGSNTGIGYAIPSNLVSKVMRSLIDNGRISYSFLGISSRQIDLSLIETYRLPNNLRGVAVLEVQRGFPAAQAGLRGLSSSSVDVITAINGVPVRNFDELIGWLAINTNPNDNITLTIYRDGQYYSVPVTLTERPSR
jgi:2-alkenal reductase